MRSEIAIAASRVGFYVLRWERGDKVEKSNPKSSIERQSLEVGRHVTFK
jgi:hypothetical protein